MGLTDQRKRAKNTADYQQNEKKITDYRHGPTLSTFVFRKLRSAENFVFFLVYEVTTLKLAIEFPVIFLLFGRKSAGSFYRTISGTQAHETSHCNSGIRRAQPHNYTKQQQLPIKPKKFGLMTVQVPVQGATFNMRGQPGVQSQPWQGVLPLRHAGKRNAEKRNARSAFKLG